MINGADIIDFMLTFGIGFITGAFFGLVITSLAVASSRDSRERERLEESEETE